jgi:hypothetical protein
MTQPLSEIQLLDPEVKRLFLDALRSGEYEQGRLKLRTFDNKYCCLGVLTDLAVKAGVVRWIESEYGWGIEEALPNGTSHVNTTDLSDKVMRWAGLEVETCRSGNIFTGTNYQEDNLMHFNDQEDFNFAQIADVVEENV